MRKTGVLLAISSLPSLYGIGDFGPSAVEFIDILASTKIKLWQVLPLNPLGYGNSPYQSYSSFAGDEIYISPDELLKDGLLDNDQLSSFRNLTTTIDYITVRNNKQYLLRRAYQKFKLISKLQDNYQKFLEETKWLDSYAVFASLRAANNAKPWNQWPEQYRNWIIDKKQSLSEYNEEINYHKFVQFIFFRQWQSLKKYANSKGIEILGDIPIYLGFDSVDVWQNQELFLLDDKQNPTFVAGVPPDYFSKSGQRWGNPLYNWEKLAATNFDFWIKRLQGNQQMYDIIRIDHFRAFDTYWKIPASCSSAIEGEWVEAPGYQLFDTIFQKLPEIRIVAEDLGELRPEVLKLRDHYNLPGMKVFQFIFDPFSDNAELVKVKNSVAYTATHDNSTLMGWYWSLKNWRRKQLKRYFKANNNSIKNKILNYLLKSDSDYVIFPVQDILGLGDEARINYPGTIGSPNWEWKLADFCLLRAKVETLRNSIERSNR